MGAGESTMASPAIKQSVDQLIKANKVMIFSKSYCPYCTMAKKVCASLTSGLLMCLFECSCAFEVFQEAVAKLGSSAAKVIRCAALDILYC